MTPALRAALAVALLLPLAGPAAAHEHAPNLRAAAWPLDVEPGVPTRVAWYVENQNGAYAPQAFRVDVYVDGALFESVVVPSAGEYGVEYWESSATFVGTEGVRHAFRVVVDAEDAVPESDESDNDWVEHHLFTADRSDLALEVLDASVDGWPQSVARVEYRLCNVGTRAMRNEAVVWFDLQGGYPAFGAFEGKQDRFDGLAPGACVEGAFVSESMRRLGEYAWTVTAEAEHETARERYGPENEAAGTFAIGPALPGLL